MEIAASDIIVAEGRESCGLGGNQELTESRVGTVPNGLNSTALDLEQFINSAKSNQGYYMARYESSNTTKGNSKENAKPVYNMDQVDASNAARAMYSGDEFVLSDLVNSYAWDTAIVFIQKCSDSTNYANEWRGTSALCNTGKTSDIECNIYDMSNNVAEWNTEYAGKGTVTGMNNIQEVANTGVYGLRGGWFNSDSSFVTSWRSSFFTPFALSDVGDYLDIRVGFRVLMYVI